MFAAAAFHARSANRRVTCSVVAWVATEAPWGRRPRGRRCHRRDRRDRDDDACDGRDFLRTVMVVQKGWSVSVPLDRGLQRREW